MLLYLMQHGVSLPKEAAPDEPLSPIGLEQVEKTAIAAAELGISFDTIIASPKLRAQETAEIMASATGYPVSNILTSTEVKAMTPAQQTIAMVDTLVDARSVLITGHMPNLSKVASLLITGDDRQRIAVQNSGLLCIEIPGPRARHGSLIFSISPAQIALMAKGVRRRI